MPGLADHQKFCKTVFDTRGNALSIGKRTQLSAAGVQRHRLLQTETAGMLFRYSDAEERFGHRSESSRPERFIHSNKKLGGLFLSERTELLLTFAFNNLFL